MRPPPTPPPAPFYESPLNGSDTGYATNALSMLPSTTAGSSPPQQARQQGHHRPSSYSLGQDVVAVTNVKIQVEEHHGIRTDNDKDKDASRSNLDNEKMGSIPSVQGSVTFGGDSKRPSILPSGFRTPNGGGGDGNGDSTNVLRVRQGPSFSTPLKQNHQRPLQGSLSPSTPSLNRLRNKAAGDNRSSVSGSLTASSHSSGRSRTRSFASSQSSGSTNIILEWYNRGERWVLQSRAYAVVMTALDTPWVQMAVIGAYFVMLMAFIIFLIFFLFDRELPGIHYYNLFHIALHILGKNVLLAGILLANVTAKSLLAHSLIRQPLGINLTDLTFRLGEHRPAGGRSVRRIFYVSLIAVELALWLLEYEMEFMPVTSSILGRFPCIPASYPTAVAPVDGLMAYLQGNVRLALAYNYFLPLVDGAIGGWAAWPSARPARSFSMSGQGVVFLAGSRCSHPEQVSGPQLPVAYNATLLYDGQQQRAPAASFEFIDAYNWNSTLYYFVQVTLPAFTHNVAQLADRDVAMLCQTELILGPGLIEVSISADEWQSMSGVQLNTVTLADPYKEDRAAAAAAAAAGNLNSILDIPTFPDDLLVLGKGMGGTVESLSADGGANAGRGQFKGEARERLFPLAKNYANITAWIGDQIELLLTADATRPGAAGLTAAAKATARAAAAASSAPSNTTTTTTTAVAASTSPTPATPPTPQQQGPTLPRKRRAAKKQRPPRPPPVFPVPALLTNPTPTPPGLVSCGHASSTALTCDLLAWATDPTGRINVELMQRGFIALTAATAHFVLNQYDGTAVSTCTYFGDLGRGAVTAPLWIRATVAASLGAAATLAAAVVASFFLAAASAGPASAQLGAAAAMLDDPLRLLPVDGNRIKLRLFLQDVRVRFGESKSSRGEEVGELTLDVPANVIKLRKDRHYE
ncbi:hypothetical protein DFJ73DRAFT_793382 [Zopfochytrium polystomum]|nr:hypothetical protein DFJ73DRAFT_793382 [Zopfochytrium polystomum]